MDVSAVKRRRVKDTPMLPDELVEEIFTYLPAKSLCRFECLSRSWRQVISSSGAFHDLHSKRASACRDRRRLFVRPADRPWQSFYAWQPTTDGGSSSTAVVEEIMVPSFLDLPQGGIFPVTTKCCHGLVLLCCIEYGTYYVWNPSTRDIRQLPDRRPQIAYYGMGYCSTTSRYKVVRMYLVGASEAARRTVCEVFTLGESEYWRLAATIPPMILTPHQIHGVAFYNNNLHFIGPDGPEYTGFIITTFSVTDETFGMLTPPQGLKVHDDYGLTELNGCLCVYTSCHHDPTEDRPYTIWFLRDYEAGCWEKLVCVDWGSMSEPERTSLGSLWIAPLDVYRYQSGNKGNLQKKIMFGTGKCKVFTVDPSNNGGVPEILFSLENVVGDSMYLPTMGFFEESLRSVNYETATAISVSSSSSSSQASSSRVWDHVLPRLPARSLGRLCQVSRKWRAIIKNDLLFIDRQFQFHADIKKSPQVMFTDGKEGNFNHLLENFINTSESPVLVGDAAKIVCSKPCRGLNAGSYAGYDFVTNPTTGYYKAIRVGYDSRELRGHALQKDIALRSPKFTEADYAVFTGRLGFGYDEKVGKHALVRLTYLERNLETRAYKLDCKFRYVEDMYWGGLDPPLRPIANTPPAHVNGKLYWMVDNRLGERSPRQEILVLDLSTREFEVLQGPMMCMNDSDNSSDCASSAILELQEVVCVANSRHSTNTIEIWEMMDDAKGSSWFMKHRIELERFSPEYSTYVTTMLAVDPTCGKVLLSTGKALGYYDPKTTELETIFRLGNHVSRSKKFVPVLVQESLVNPCDRVRLKGT